MDAKQLSDTGALGALLQDASYGDTNNLHRLTNTGALGALLRATEDAAVFRSSAQANSEQHARAVDKREKLRLEVLRRLGRGR